MRHASFTPLLQAALWQPPAAVAAWEAWVSELDFDALDAASMRLLPLVYHNLQNEVIHPLFARWKGLQRHSWYHNQLLRVEIETVVQGLAAVNVPVLLLKGLALVAGYYHDWRLRPMHDADLYTPAAHLPTAVHWLTAHGWACSAAASLNDAAYLAADHAASFRKGRASLDLHWHVFNHYKYFTADATLWQAATPLQWATTPVWALQPADQLVHVCVHGVQWEAPPLVQWAADAWWIIQHPPDLSWARVLELARRFRLALPLGDALGWLHHALAAPIPPWVLAALAALPTTRQERFLYHQRTSAPDADPWMPLRGQAAFFLKARALRPPTQPWQHWAQFLDMYQRLWAVPQRRHLPLVAARKAVRRARLILQNTKSPGP